ncbi:MAG: hypothetical protein LBU60_01605 [Clostridiales bacterium]|nr:hypothetical protein [Clostridiales bacterium]
MDKHALLQKIKNREIDVGVVLNVLVEVTCKDNGSDSIKLGETTQQELNGYKSKLPSYRKTSLSSSDVKIECTVEQSDGTIYKYDLSIKKLNKEQAGALKQIKVCIYDSIESIENNIKTIENLKEFKFSQQLSDDKISIIKKIAETNQRNKFLKAELRFNSNIYVKIIDHIYVDAQIFLSKQDEYIFKQLKSFDEIEKIDKTKQIQQSTTMQDGKKNKQYNNSNIKWAKITHNIIIARIMKLIIITAAKKKTKMPKLKTKLLKRKVNL